MGISSVGTLENAAISRSRMAVQHAEVRQSRGTGQKAAAQPADVVSKNIQNEISEVQRQKQGLSSKQEMSEGERSKKKQELQQELSSLNTRLRQRQAEVSRKQKQADRLEELSAPDTDMRTRRAEGSNTGKTAQNSKAGKNTEQSMGTEASFTKEAAEKMAGTGDAERSAGQTKRSAGQTKRSAGQTKRSAGQIRHSTEQTKRNAEKTERSSEDDRDEKPKTGGIPQDKMQAIVGGDIFREQTERREVVIARIEGGIAILKGEIRQDEMLGNDVQNKKTELKAREAKVKNAANGLPVVNAPGRKSDKILRNAGRVKAEAEEHVKNRILKTSPDGVVVLKSDNGTLQFR